MQTESNNSNLIQIVEPIGVNSRIAAGDTFVVNVVAAWCPDCTVRQKQHIDNFAQEMKSHGIDVLQVNVQLQRGDFISTKHEAMTTQFGGHGYPRTVLIRHGNIADQDNVEVVTEEGLSVLAKKFIEITTEQP